MIEDIVRNRGLLTLGSRMRRIGERLQADTQRIIDEAGLPIQSGHYPFLAAIDSLGPLTVGELAQAVGITQPGVTRTLGQLAKLGLLDLRQSSDDQRRKTVFLTKEGTQLLEFSKKNVWPRVEAAVGDLCGDLEGPLLAQLTAIENGLAEQPLHRRGRDEGK